MLDKTIESHMVKTHILFFLTPTHFARYMLFPKIRAKRVGVFYLSELEKGSQREVALCIPPLIRSINTLLFEYPDIF